MSSNEARYHADTADFSIIDSDGRHLPKNACSCKAPPRWPSGCRPKFDSSFRLGSFSRWSHTSNLKIGKSVATLPGA